MTSKRAGDLSFDQLAMALFFLFVAVTACLMPAQNDTWWQLRTGEEMWRSRRVMLHDQFTHTVFGQPWPNHEWLAQVVFYGLYRAGGLPLLTAVCAAAATLSWVIIARLTSGPLFLRLSLLGAGAALSSPNWSLRPQVFTLVLLATTMWLVVRQRWLWILPLLFLVWANLHGAVALGGAFLAAACGAALLMNRDRFRTLALVAFVCLLCTAATPLGFTLWFEVPSSLSRLHAYGVQEWRPPGLALADAPFWIAAAGLVALAAVGRRLFRSSWNAAALGCGLLLFLALALQSRRNFGVFLLCGVPLAATLLNSLLRPAATPRQTERPLLNGMLLATATAVSILCVGIAWSQPLTRLGWRPVPDALVQALSRCSGPLYNRYDDGGYLIWFVRDQRVFMDSRQDPFPEELVHRQIQLEASGDYRDLFGRYGIGCALTERGSVLAASLARDGWREESGDSWAVFSAPQQAGAAVTPGARTLSR